MALDPGLLDRGGRLRGGGRSPAASGPERAKKKLGENREEGKEERLFGLSLSSRALVAICRFFLPLPFPKISLAFYPPTLSPTLRR